MNLRANLFAKHHETTKIEIVKTKLVELLFYKNLNLGCIEMKMP